MDRKPEKLVMEMEVWAVYAIEDGIHTGFSLSDDYIVQTFFKNKECAEYVAKVLEDFWEVPHIIMRRIIYVDSIQQDKVYGAVLYFGDDIYVYDDHVFSTTEDVYKYSVIYQYYKELGDHEMILFYLDIVIELYEQKEDWQNAYLYLKERVSCTATYQI